MALRELSDAEWQHSFVPVLRLAGPGSSTPSGDADPRSREHAVGDVKHVMDKTIGRRCCRISGAVSAANYLEVPREARTAPLNLTGRFVYIQVRPIGTKAMTFHLDVLDSDGQPTRATFSTLYSESPAVPAAAAEAFITPAGSHGRGTTLGGSKHANGVAGVPWKSVGNSSGGSGCAEGISPSRALVRRGGALRCPVFFDTSRSFGWTVVAVDLVKLMSQGQGQAGGKGYKALRGVRLGANMVVRGVYVSDCVYSPRTLPKEMTFRAPGGGDWETAYGWLWLPEVPDENAAPPPPPPPPLQDGVDSNRPAWPPGAESPTLSVAAAHAAEAHGRRRMEKRHFQTRSSSLGKLLAHDADDDGGDEAAAVVARNERAAGPPSPRRAQGGPPAKKLSASSAGGAAPSSVSWRNTSSSRRVSLSVSPARGPRARSKSVGAGGRAHPSTPPRAAHVVATPTRMRPAHASVAAAAVTPRSKTPSRVRHRGNLVPSPIAAATNGRPPLSPKVCRQGRGTPTPKFRKKKAFFCDGDGDVVGDTTTGGVDGGDSDERIARGEQGESWRHRKLEDWAPAAEDRATPTPSVAVLGATRRAGDGSGWSESKGGPDPPVVTRVLPLGLENHRPNPPEFVPDPALRLERALGYTGGLPETLAFLGGAAFVAFPCNNVIVLIETPVMPEPFFPAQGEENGGGGGISEEKKVDDESPPAPHAFLRGHTDTVTLLHVSNGGHLLVSAQGDPLGAAGGHGIVRIWDTSSLGSRAGTGDVSGGGKCVAHFEGHRWGVTSMCFSSDDRLLCTVGGDEHRRTQVVVWDVGILCATRAGTVHGSAVRRAIVARQISDFPITRILFSPFEKLRLVSCGRENVRFWRIRRQHLPACPAVLNDFARDLECTDLAFQRACHGIAGAEGGVDWGDGPCVVYVSSRVGTVLQVSYHTRNLLCVLQLHDEPILSLTFTEWCAITCSADKLLRLWPLDFSDFLMEAAHESSVVSACSSGDGLKLAVGTAEGSIGVLDVMTHGYTTALRSHRGGVTAVAVDPCPEREEFATVSEDSTVRVWDLATGAQLYQFSSPEDEPTCIAYAPPCRRNGPVEGYLSADGVASKWDEGEEDFPGDRHLVAGYASGAMRVFDVPSASTVFECQQHESAVHEVVFTPDGSRVVSVGADGLMCVYDGSRGYLPTKVVACDAPEAGRRIRLSVSPGSDRLAVIGTEPSCILLYELSSMILKRRLGKPGRRGIGFRSLFGVASGGSGPGMGAAAPRPYRSKSYDSIAAGAGIGAGGADAMIGGFLHAEFSGDGSEILACTATKLFRFPLGGGEVNAWSSLLPCKAGPALAACYPPSGPGLVLVSPAPAVGAGGPTDPVTHGNGYGGSKRGAAPRGVGGGGSELFLSRVHRDDQSSSVVLSVPQAFAVHASPLTAAAFSPVGDRLVTCDGTGVVLLWTNLAAPRPEAWATSRTPPQDDASRVAANNRVRRAGGSLFCGKHRDYGDVGHDVGAAGVGIDAAVAAANAAAAMAAEVHPLTFPGSDDGDDDEEDQEGNEECIDRDGMISSDALPASSGATGRIPVPLDPIVSNYGNSEAEEAKRREMGTRAPESGVAWAPAAVSAASAWIHRGRGGVAAGLPPLPPVTPSGRRGRGDGFASMLDQTPSSMAAAEAAVRGGYDRTASGTPRAEGGPRPSGQLARALASLQTAVEEAAAAVGEAEAAESSSKQTEEEKDREAKRSLETSSPLPEAEGPDGCFDGYGRMRVTVGEPLRSKDGKVGVRERFCSKELNVSAPAAAAAVAVAEAATNQGGDADCVTWQPSSGRLLYTQGDSLFAEELDSCRRWVLFDSSGPGTRAAAPVVAVSSCGEHIARASRRDDPNGVSRSSGGRLSVWCLSRNNTASNGDNSGSSSDCSGCGSDFGTEVNDRRPEIDLNYAVPTVLEAAEEDGIVALAFSPSGSEVCSLGEWDGSRCLLRTRLLSATARFSAGTIAGVSAIASRAVTSVTLLSAKTSAICVLPGREDWHDGRQSFLIVTGGHEGVALWKRVRGEGKSSGVAGAGAIDRISRCVRDSEGDGGVRLLGAYPGVRANALASVGRFVVAAEVLGAPGRVSVTAMDVDWLAAGGHHGDNATAGIQRPVGDEEFSWQAFGGSDDVSITCLATAGSRSVAVGGSGGKLEIWDVEAAFWEGGRTRKGARAGLVRRLDLRDALLGASVTDMTWDAGGTDAVLGAGGKIWHLHVPRESGGRGGTISPSKTGRAGEPTLARVWPGGNVQTG